MEEQFFDYTKPLQYWNKDSQPKKGKKFQDPNFPPNENSLIGKDANGEFIDKIDGEDERVRYSKMRSIFYLKEQLKWLISIKVVLEIVIS